MNSDMFLILFLIFIAMISLFPLLLKRFGVPTVISLLIAGMLISPNCLNLVHRLIGWLSFLVKSPAVAEQNFNSLITALGSLGLVFLMALAGMEADFKLIASARRPVITLSLLTFFLPALTGYLVYRHFCPDDFPGKLLYASLFASHSVGIVFPVIRELKLSRSRFGAAVLISTIITDVASIILLAVSVQLHRLKNGSNGSPHTLSLIDTLNPQRLGNWFSPLFLIVVILFLTLSILIVARLGKALFNRVSRKDDLLITYLILVILLTVLTGEILGINLIVGAFIAGLALSPLMQNPNLGSVVFRKFEGMGYGLMIPFLFLSIGMQTDFGAFASVDNLQIVLLTVIGLVGSKIFSGWLAMRLCGFDHVKGLCAGLMTVPQLSATLAAAAVGKNIGMLNENFFNSIVILSVVTTIPIPSLVRWLFRHFRITFDFIGEEAVRVPDQPANDELAEF